MDYYNSTKEMGNTPYCFPNYISNVGSSLYFLIRLEPFTDEEIGFQSGSFDAADRTFQSLTITKDFITSHAAKSALELVPEIYLLPELFENNNDLKFPKSPINPKDISNVELPDWCKGSPYKLVRNLRKALESDQVSEKINEWIDLIWGVRREGQLAYEKCNSLQSLIFSFNPEEYMNDRLMLKALSDQMHNCGQAPLQLFTTFHPKRNYKAPGKLRLVTSNESIPLNDDALFFKIERNDGWNKLSNGMKVRVSCSSIELNRNKYGITSFPFSDEIGPICCQTDGNDIVTGHKLPVINHWISTDVGIKHIASLRGHMEKISYTAISNNCKLIISGHIDGKLSVFTTNPHKFLRIISTDTNVPIEFIYVFQPTSAIIVFQRVDESSTKLTLFSCNGKLLATNTLRCSALNCNNFC